MSALERIELRGWPWPIEVHYYESSQEPGTWVLQVASEVPCSRTGEDGYFQVTEYFTSRQGPEVLRVSARSAILRHLGHEVDERLFIDGERAADPHESDEPRCVCGAREDRLTDGRCRYCLALGAERPLNPRIGDES